MRILLRPILSIALACVAWTSALFSFVGDCAVRIGGLFREAFDLVTSWMPELRDMPRPIRRIVMFATSLNGRHVGGVRVKGFLGRPTVRMLTG